MAFGGVMLVMAFAFAGHYMGQNAVAHNAVPDESLAAVVAPSSNIIAKGSLIPDGTGLEIVNPSLAVSGSVPQDPNAAGYRYGWWWWGPWYEHQNMRDERAEAFAPLLWEGVYDYSYVARATTPGTFVVPPARAEEMYSPEVFGLSLIHTSEPTRPY